jgi:cytochrome P450
VEELQSCFHAAHKESRQPTAVEIADAKIPYLDAVIDEVLRLNPAAPLVVRESIVDTELLGHRIPKGTTIFLVADGPGLTRRSLQVDNSLRSESSRTKHWGGAWNEDDIEMFKPERWLKKDTNGETVFDPTAGPILSFSLGPRACFGRRLAYLELRMVLVLLLWNFKFKELEGELSSYDVTESITIMPKHCYVGLEKLNHV